jgi:hypothetical protein
MNLAAVDPIAPARDEEIRGHRPLPPVMGPAAEVLGEDLAGRPVERDKSRFAELRATDGQHGGVKVDIAHLEVSRLADAETRDTQQAEERVVQPRAQPSTLKPAGQVERGAQEPANLSAGVQVRSGPLRLKGQEPRGRDLGAGIGRAAIPGKAAHETQAPGPMHRLGVDRQLRPGERQRLGNHGRAALLQEPDEVEEPLPRLVELEAEMTSHSEVFVYGLTERGHCAPPGHGRASVRNAGRSTLAYTMVVCGLRCRRISPISVNEAPRRNMRVASACRN